ncbi:MAG: MraY family glycosyltransferase, partial [Patescibacteria group bacterium]
TFCWILGTTYTTKVLDGVDGLVSGVAGIGFMIIGFLCMGNVVHQPDTALISFLIAGCYFGFLIFNFNPAKIFLGESGSTIAGFLLGSLAIIAGGKIAITLLVLSVPIIDFLIVIISRILSGKSPFKGDRRHLHYRLRNIGLNDRQVVFVIYGITIFFGSIGLITNSLLKFWAIISAFLFMIIGLFIMGYIRKRLKNKV